MSITGASSRFCESATRRMLQETEEPHFEKTMTNVMLRRSEWVGILVKSIRAHGGIIHTPELCLTGPNGHSRTMTLKELPFRFVKERGHKFQARSILLGPSGRLRIASLRIMPTGRRGRSRVQIQQGWKNFALEHGFKVGDVLLFSLVGLSKFIVQLFPSV